MAAIVNLEKVPNWRDKDVKIVLSVLNQDQYYKCDFICGQQSKCLLGLGQKEIKFAGFTKIESTGHVKRFRLEDGTSGDSAFEISIYKAIRRPMPLPSTGGYDEVDGPCNVRERNKPSVERYVTNNDYSRGERLLQLYILFNTED
ncbi:uncharacterized protein LOC120351180 [Nilaparvata lugens]|uniref:uncharacterized protein LOC120351180 n=1 Tax=Nilaparvata lugens TaxID=108931 RepID=UPI00193EB963|nr:uncharacterized protein LOC120351180 [Nilaparvata lugens]